MEDQNLQPTTCEHCEEYLAGWKRAQADYQNLKKETEREKVEYAKYANERLLSDILPAIDQFHLALSHLPPENAEQKTWVNWITGLKAVGTLWDQAAKAAGLDRIAASGAFDPKLHEAVGSEVAEGQESGSIVRVMQEGWALYGKVLRPARVIIAS